MADIKDLGKIGEKFERVTPGRQADFIDGVENPRADWEDQTVKASKNFATGVQAAIADNRFENGVKKAGTEKWRKKTLQVGPGRWAEGVASAGPAYAAGFQPYHDVIKNLKLPPRGPTGSAQNLQRVAAINKALHDKKLEIGKRG